MDFIRAMPKGCNKFSRARRKLLSGSVGRRNVRRPRKNERSPKRAPEAFAKSATAAKKVLAMRPPESATA
jgi:hypothetical protein